jgi:hypothetical protein
MSERTKAEQEVAEPKALEAARKFILDRDWEMFLTSYFGMSGKLLLECMADFAASQVSAAKREQMEKDCKSMCQMCAYDIPILAGTNYHIYDGGKSKPILCAASAIRKSYEGE